MKIYVSSILFLLLSIGSANGQIQFEISDNFGNSGEDYSYWGAATEVDSGYFFAGGHSDFGANNMQLLLLDTLGEFVDSMRIYTGDTVIRPKLAVKVGQSFVVMGAVSLNGNDSIMSYLKATFSADLVLTDSILIPLPEIGFGLGNVFQLYWEVPSDTVLFINNHQCGWINTSTREMFSKYFDINLVETVIIPRKNKQGYLISGFSINLLDEEFNMESYYNIFEMLGYPGWAGVDVEYITDSTWMFASHFDTPSFSTAYVDTGTMGVIVGVMTEDFEVLNTDTLLMPFGGSWTFLPFDQYLLERSVDSTFIVAGITWPYIGDYRHLFFAKYSNTGERLSYTTYSTPEDYKYDIHIKATSDGGCLFYGARRGLGDSEFYILKVGPDGTIVTETTIPMGIAPIQVYPNPTLDIIRFDLKDVDSTLDFELVDMSGRTVLRQKVSGPTEISTSHLPQGVYGYRLLKHGEPIYTGKMVKE